MATVVKPIVERIPKELWTALGFFLAGPLVGLSKALVLRVETPLGKVMSGTIDGLLGVWLGFKTPIEKPEEVKMFLKGLGYFMAIEGFVLSIMSVTRSVEATKAYRRHTAIPSAYV